MPRSTWDPSYRYGRLLYIIPTPAMRQATERRNRMSSMKRTWNLWYRVRERIPAKASEVKNAAPNATYSKM